MHEVGIIKSMLRTVKGVMDVNGLTKVGKIVVQIGEISGVVPRQIQECYAGAVYKTPFEETLLDIEVIPGIVRCNHCGKEFNGFTYNLKCPDCNGEDLTALSGREFLIKQIEAY
ncbi:MAG: hydrogenase maturation nickel metallochaperone HypA [Lachnospiraceae bacterium]